MARARARTAAKKPRQRNPFSGIEKRLARIERILITDTRIDHRVEHEEEEELAELKKIEELETTIKQDLAQHPLTKITYHDITKGLIGSFFGVVGHFAFFKGPELASHLSMLRATALIFCSMLLLVVFLYFTGFRRIKEYHAYLPARFLVLYMTAIGVATAVLFLFGVLTFPIDFHMLYTNIAALSILAVMGAATADMIGGEA
jgi:uncharacterized membrane protein